MSMKSTMVKAISVLTAMSMLACASITGFAATYTTTTEYVIGSDVVNVNSQVTGVDTTEQVTYLVHDSAGTIADANIIYINQDAAVGGTATFAYKTTKTRMSGITSTVLVGAQTTAITAPANADNATIDPYALTVTPYTNGTVTTTGATAVALNTLTQIGKGQTISFTATPSVGYVVGSVTGATLADGVYTITGDGDKTVAVTFVQDVPNSNIAVTADNGTATLLNDAPLPTSVANGVTVTFKVTPATYYQVLSVTGAIDNGNGTYSITGDGTDKSISIVCVKPYTIAVAAYNEAQGTVAVAGNATQLGLGEEIAYTVTPLEGYEIFSIDVSGQEQTIAGTSYSVFGDANKVITVTFKEIIGESTLAPGLAPNSVISSDPEQMANNHITTFGTVALTLADQSTATFGIVFKVGEVTDSAALELGKSGVTDYPALAYGTGGKFAVSLLDGGTGYLTDRVYSTRTYLKIGSDVQYGEIQVINK